MRVFPPRRPAWHDAVDAVIATIERHERANPDYYKDPNPPPPLFFSPETEFGRYLTVNERRRNINSNIRIR